MKFIKTKNLNKKTYLILILAVLLLVSVFSIFVINKKDIASTNHEANDDSYNRIPLIRSIEKKAEELREVLAPDKKDFFLDSTSIQFGLSGKNNVISGYIFGNGSETILLMGAIHGNEKSSSTLLSQIVQELNGNKRLVGASKRVIIIPTVNPDGYKAGLEKVNANNVNPDLNFETKGWKRYGGEDNKYFAGSKPFSESESRIIRDVVLKYNVKKMLSFHAKGSLVNPEIHSPSEELARWYVSKTGYRFYEDTSWDYPGTATKWFTEAVGGPAITVELPDYNDPDTARNRKAIFELIK